MSTNGKCEDVRPPHILVADDDEDTLALFEIYARMRQWQITTAASARELIEKVNTHCSEDGSCYDIIIADINYKNKRPDAGPRITGITAIARVREKWPNVSVMFYTGYLNRLVKDEIEALPGSPDATTDIIEKAKDENSDINAVLDRAARIVEFTKLIPFYQGHERRHSTGESYSGSLRRAGDHQITIPHTVEEALTEAKAAHATRYIANCAAKPSGDA